VPEIWSKVNLQASKPGLPIGARHLCLVITTMKDVGNGKG
jgi:hypothetical protein